MTQPAHGELKRYIDCIAAAVKPRRIWLFGSHARGDARADSDIDVLVVVDDAVQPLRAAITAMRAIGAHRLPIDLVAFRQAEFDRLAEAPWTLPGTVVREGRVVWEASAHAA